jgi:exonuclease III
MSFAFRKLKQHQSRFRYWISVGWISISLLVSGYKKGYSGTAILSKVKPNKVVYGTEIEHMVLKGVI